MLTPQTGEVIAGRYHLEREIARGGMGSVWAGRDDKLRRRVAVKLLAPEEGEAASPGREARERFEREAMAAAQLQSPHVVQVFDYGIERGYPYIVMELLEGEDLRTRLHAIKRVSLEVAAQILVQTAKALSVAHAAGVIHRDLKPGNIFLVRAGEEELVKILDFGVAKSSDTNLLAAGAEHEVMGTPQFMSPEQARGLEVDHRADLWSLGVIIYKALTGHLPFRGRTPTSVIVKVCTTDPQPVSELAPDLPRELDEFFRRALAREREQRFASAREMALAFSRITPITFTTLSMPDPKEIDAAIAAAQAKARAAQADDDAPTLALDYESLETMAIDGAALLGDDQLKTSVHAPLHLPLALKPPSPPPRRSQRGPSSALPLTKPLPAAGRPATPSSLPLPRTPKGSRPSLASLPASAPVPPPEPSEPTLDRDEASAPVPSTPVPSAPVPSAPVLLSRPSLTDMPAAPSSARATPPPLPVRSRPEASVPLVSASVSGASMPLPSGGGQRTPSEPPSGPLRPSTPTLRGVGGHTSTPPAARGTRPALIMALAAVCVGVLAAWVLSAVLGPERGAVAADMPAEEDAPPMPATPTTAAAVTAEAPATSASAPSASAPSEPAETPETPVRAAPRRATPPAPPPRDPPPPAPPPRDPPPPAATPKPPPPPEPTDPFAERL